jgi:hypothetical protein
MKKFIYLLLMGLTIVALTACDKDEESSSLEVKSSTMINGITASVHYTLTSKIHKVGTNVEIPVVFEGKATETGRFTVALVSKKTGINSTRDFDIRSGNSIDVVNFNLSFKMPKDWPSDLLFYFTFEKPVTPPAE